MRVGKLQILTNSSKMKKMEPGKVLPSFKFAQALEIVTRNQKSPRKNVPLTQRENDGGRLTPTLQGPAKSFRGLDRPK